MSVVVVSIRSDDETYAFSSLGTQDPILQFEARSNKSAKSWLKLSGFPKVPRVSHYFYSTPSIESMIHSTTDNYLLSELSTKSQGGSKARRASRVLI